MGALGRTALPQVCAGGRSFHADAMSDGLARLSDGCSLCKYTRVYASTVSLEVETVLEAEMVLEGRDSRRHGAAPRGRMRGYRTDEYGLCMG